MAHRPCALADDVARMSDSQGCTSRNQFGVQTIWALSPEVGLDRSMTDKWRGCEATLIERNPAPAEPADQ